MVERIERLLAAAEPCDVTDAVKIRASDRGIEKKAPFHRQRNGMNDAILIETYADMVGEEKRAQRFAFVTHNTKDFSDPTGNQTLPHPDLAHLSQAFAPGISSPWARRCEAFAPRNTWTS